MSAELELAVEELHRRLEDEAERRHDAGLCACPCGKTLPPDRHGRRRYLDGHRGRDHARRVRLEAELRGVPARASLKTLQGPTSTEERQADAQASPQRPRARRPRPGVSVYLPRPELVRRLELELAREHLLAGEAEGAELVELLEAVRRARRRLEGRRSRA